MRSISSAGSPRLLLVLFAAMPLSGCARDDTERLARIGRKTMDRCDAMTASFRGKVSAGIESVRVSLPEPRATPAEPGTATSEPVKSASAAPVPATGTPTIPVTPATGGNATPLDARVRWRIRWDKALAGADIQVDSPTGGVVQLRGVVNDLTRQRRAVELAETTEGVDKVVSELGLKQP
jgi:hypothetical protein